MTTVKLISSKLFCHLNNLPLSMAHSKRFMNNAITNKYPEFDGDYAEMAMLELGLAIKPNLKQMTEELSKVNKNFTLDSVVKTKCIKPIEVETTEVESTEVESTDIPTNDIVVKTENEILTIIKETVNSNKLNIVKMTEKPNGVICDIRTRVGNHQVMYGYSYNQKQFFSKINGDTSVVYGEPTEVVNRIFKYVTSIDGFTYEQAEKMIADENKILREMGCDVSTKMDGLSGYYTVTVHYYGTKVGIYGWYRGTGSFFNLPINSRYAMHKFTNNLDAIVDGLIEKVEKFKKEDDDDDNRNSPEIMANSIMPKKSKLNEDAFQEYLKSLDDGTFWKEYEKAEAEGLF